MRLNHFLLTFGCLLLLSACEKAPIDFYDGVGKKPVYIPLAELKNIKNLPPQPVVSTGTIFLRDSLFFLMEQRKGIHVYHVKDSLNTIHLTFLNIPAITDFTLSGNYIYADSWKDLVTIDISNLLEIKEVSRVTGVVSPVLYPLLYNGYFECVDESKGAVVDWKEETLEDARCVTLN